MKPYRTKLSVNPFKGGPVRVLLRFFPLIFVVVWFFTFYPKFFFPIFIVGSLWTLGMNYWDMGVFDRFGKKK